MAKEKTLNEICSEKKRLCPLCKSGNLHDLSVAMFYIIMECLDCGCQWEKFRTKDWKITRSFDNKDEWEKYKKEVKKNFRGTYY